MRRIVTQLTGMGLILGLMLTVGVIAGQGQDGARTTKARHFEVEMTGGNTFDPDDFEIAVGDTVLWVNRSGAQHTATSDAGSMITFEKQVVEKQRFSKRVTFDKAGTATYFCENHPATMKGKITVK